MTMFCFQLLLIFDEAWCLLFVNSVSYVRATTASLTVSKVDQFSIFRYDFPFQKKKKNSLDMKNCVKIVTDNFKKQIELNLKITNTGFT